jgi:HAD superfamily hydrolase (TIGR01549 family)
VTGAYVLLEQFENLYLLPRVVGRRIFLHPGVVIVGAVVGAELAGVLGILLAAPVIASLRVLLTYALRKLFDEGPVPTVEGVPRRELLWRDVVREREVRGVFFDLDGTLVETDGQLTWELAGRLRPLHRVLSEQERLRLARRRLMRGEIVVNRVITWLGRLRLDNLMLRMDDRLRRWRGIAKPEQFTAVAGSIESLTYLSQKGFCLGVVTSRARKDVEVYLDQFHLDGLFDTIVTRDEVERLKPHPLPVLLAAQELGIAPSQCVLVGDTGVDVRSAKAAGALSVGVLCGLGERNDFEGADLVLDSPAQLVEWL